MFVDHEHTHQWQYLGVGSSNTGWTVIYECTDCDAWTSQNLTNESRVPFREGEIVKHQEGTDDTEQG